VNLIELIEQFPDNEACRKHLIQVRWPEGVKCPRCQSDQVSELKGRKQWTCLACRYRFSATAGTIFHKSHIGLRKWFLAIFIVLNAKKSLSSLQMKRELKISQECCWHMIHRIREAMREGTVELFRGGVQMDEFFAGGKARPEAHKSEHGMHGRATDRPVVIGAVEENSGHLRTKHVPNMKKGTVLEAGQQWLDMPNVELHTDQFKSYALLGRGCAGHRTVDHRVAYVQNGISTNRMENAWSLFARALMGSFHHVSRKHLHRYLSEFDSRFNSRRDDLGHFFDRVLGQADGRRLPHAQLVG
jgi:transposase-like protein